MKAIKTLGDLRKALSIYEDDLPLEVVIYDSKTNERLVGKLDDDSAICKKVDSSGKNKPSLLITVVGE